MRRKRFTIRAVGTVACAFAVGASASSVRGDDPQWAEQASFAFWGMELPPPHRIIQPPAPLVQQAEPPSSSGLSETPHVRADGRHGAAAARYEANRRGHGWQKPAPATIPGAVVESVWRTPYSYGYFGAGRHRHWQRHYGLQQAFTQWTLK